jgi:hypothetical protein
MLQTVVEGSRGATKCSLYEVPLPKSRMRWRYVYDVRVLLLIMLHSSFRPPLHDLHMESLSISSAE